MKSFRNSVVEQKQENVKMKRFELAMINKLVFNEVCNKPWNENN
jgi:hypothetical protein